MDERRLAQKLKNGDRFALNRVMDAYTPYLSVVAFRALGANAPREDVEELVSDVFLSLWRHRDRLDPERGLKSYLAAIARNRATDLRRAPAPAPLPLTELEQAGGPGPEEAVERRQLARHLRRQVEALGPPDDTLVLRYYFEGEALADIARDLGLSVPAAKSRLHRARRRLREALEKGGICGGSFG